MSGLRLAEIIIVSATRLRTAKALCQQWTLRYLKVVDYIGTLEMEVNHIWPARWSAVKVVFLLSRYLAFVDVPLAIHYDTSLGLSSKTCRVLFTIETSFIFLGVALAEAIVFLRLWVLSGLNRKLFIALLPQYLMVHNVEAAIFGRLMPKMVYPASYKKVNILVSLLFGLVLANQLKMGSSTFLQCQIYIPIPNCLGFEAFSAANVAIIMLAPAEYNFLLVILVQRVVNGIFANCMVLHLHDSAENEGVRVVTVTATGTNIQAFRYRDTQSSFTDFQQAQRQKAPGVITWERTHTPSGSSLSQAEDIAQIIELSGITVTKEVKVYEDP
ncbi:hypothetical protein DFP72DRAFT_1042511 [Ephemerocybe angulata]|uniref:DUF6533 domain-containing protein n=1 Tax=Ephemerocybe angulata TaxID=980116 RepID=A0A8H6I7R9_9AGAR|nr:hypothetical protein DFP72DRAFT_1042511 [Tulosesus angulatus]